MSIDYEKDGHIAVVRINRPEAMNCLNQADAEEMGRVWIEFRDDDHMRVAILTGAGDKAFCAGADLGDLIPKINSGEFPISPTFPGVLKNLKCYKPIIAAINGYCLAGGTEILQGTDIRIAVEEAVFGLPEVQLGLFPYGGSTVRLPRQIPYCWAMEILLTGDSITAEQALKIGFINRIVPSGELMPTTMAIADRLNNNGPLALKAIKESVLKSYDIPKEHAYFLEAFLAKQVFGTGDAVEGPKAFFEKRNPVFEGK